MKDPIAIPAATPLPKEQPEAKAGTDAPQAEKAPTVMGKAAQQSVQSMDDDLMFKAPVKRKEPVRLAVPVSKVCSGLGS